MIFFPRQCTRYFPLDPLSTLLCRSKPNHHHLLLLLLPQHQPRNPLQHRFRQSSLQYSCSRNRVQTVLLLDEENVNEIGRWEKGSKGGGVLMAMNATSMWEVKVVYADDPIGRAQEEADRGEDAFVL